jgi:hypothetical protein
MVLSLSYVSEHEPELLHMVLIWGLLGTLLTVVLITGLVLFMIAMPGASFAGPLPPLTSEQLQLEVRLRAHVQMLAGEIGPRNMRRREGLDKSLAYIQRVLTETGLKPIEQPFSVRGTSVSNVYVQIPGAAQPDEIVVVGAHYDSVDDDDCPAANDNASGVAAVLELAKVFAKTSPRRTIRFYFFVNEEPPYFHSDEMGSYFAAEQSRKAKEKVVAMLSIETIGYYTNEPNSQRYPPMFDRLFPTTGNFIGFVGDLNSAALVRKTLRIFRDTTPFPSEGVAAPGGIPGIGWSDHWSYWEAGFPAVMVTDTAPFRYPHYHQRSDTPEKLDYGALARVTSGLIGIVRSLSQEH